MMTTDVLQIRPATQQQAEVLALLGRITYEQSHGHFIEDKQELSNYYEQAFDPSNLAKDLANKNNRFHLVYYKNFPVGYTKLVLNQPFEGNAFADSCRLERIYILQEFLHLKLGNEVLDFLINKARTLHFKNMWLTVYIKNERALHFYTKNNFTKIGSYDFNVGSLTYENTVLNKTI